MGFRACRGRMMMFGVWGACDFSGIGCGTGRGFIGLCIEELGFSKWGVRFLGCLGRLHLGVYLDSQTPKPLNPKP